MIVGSCDAVGPLACLIAGSLVLTAIVFAAVAIFAALDRGRKHYMPSHDARGRSLPPSYAIANLYSSENEGTDHVP